MKQIEGLKQIRGTVYEGKTPKDHVTVEEEGDSGLLGDYARMGITRPKELESEEVALVRIAFDLSSIDQISEGETGEALLSYATGFSISLPEVKYDKILPVWAEVKK